MLLPVLLSVKAPVPDWTKFPLPLIADGQV